MAEIEINFDRVFTGMLGHTGYNSFCTYLSWVKLEKEFGKAIEIF